MKLPKEPTLEDLTREQLLYLIRNEMAVSIPNARQLATCIWRVEIKRNQQRMEANGAAGRRLAEDVKSYPFHKEPGKHMEAQAAYLENLREFDEIMRQRDRLEEYFINVVCQKEQDNV